MSSKHNLQIARRFQLGALVTAAALACAAPVLAAGEMNAGPKSGLPVPRFVSLKPDRVNVRGGPTRDHEVTFVYTRAGLQSCDHRGVVVARVVKRHELILVFGCCHCRAPS